MLPRDLETAILRILDGPEDHQEPALARLSAAHPEHAAAIRAHAAAVQRESRDGEPSAMAAAHTPPANAVPKQIGPYKILDVLGEGGMGTVYLAEQKEPVRRRVALKLIKPGMDSKAVVNRFEAERQALAMMEHDNIARIYDCGLSATGQPYFAMEYVKGVPIHRYCDDNKLSIEERIALFRQVCSGVQHAHNKGVIHRDLTPNNLLVTLQDGRPTPKIIDFGLARATDHRLVEATIFTQQGQVVGTPEYMSPEQAGLSGLDIDTRTDIYTLGVLLYQLLVGELPISARDLRQAGLLEMQRRIREEEPPRPSTKLTTLGDASSQIAARRRIDPRTLRRQLRSDLDWVVMKALEKDRTRRYETASEFASDLQRYLDHEVVLAGPPGLGYRLRKFTRRYRAALAVATAVFLALSLGLGAAVWQWNVARENGAIAEQARIETARERDQVRAARDATEKANAATQQALDRAKWQAYVANVNLAGAYLEDGNHAEAWQRLQACPTEHRGWEWQQLSLVQDTSLQTWEIPGAGINGLRLGPDGTRLYATDNDGRLWHKDTGATSGFLQLADCGSPARSLDTDRNGGLLVTGHFDGTVQLRRLDGALVRTIQAHPRRACAAISRDGRVLVTAGSDGMLKKWDAARGVELAGVATGGRDIEFLVLQEGAGLVWSAEDFTVRRWDVATLQAAGETGIGRSRRGVSGVTALALSPDGSRLAAANAGGGIEILDTASLARVTFLAPHLDTVGGLAFNADGTRLASVGFDQTVQLIEPASGKVVGVLRGSRYVLSAVAFDATGHRVFAAEFGPMVRMWDARQDVAVPRLEQRRELSSVAVDSAGRFVATGDWDGNVVVRDAVTCREVLRIPAVGTGPPVRKVAFHPKEALLASVTAVGDLRVHEVPQGSLRLCVRAHQDVAGALAFSADGRRIITGGWDDQVKVWDLESGQLLRQWTVSASANDLGVSHDGRWLAVAQNDFRLSLWSMDDYAKAWDVKENGHVQTVAFRPGDGLLASGSTADTVVLRRVEDGTRVATIRGHADRIWDVLWSPDGRRLFSASAEGSIRIWDPESRELLANLRLDPPELAAQRDGDQYGFKALAMTPDGARLFAGTCSVDSSGSLMVWETRLEGLRAVWQARAIAARADAVLAEALGVTGDTAAALAAVQARVDLPEPVRQEAIRLGATRAQELLLQKANGVLDGLFDEHMLLTDVLAELQGQDWDAETIARLTTMAKERGDASPRDLNTRSWSCVVAPGQDTAVYAKAVRWIEAACKAEPESHYYRNTLGVALYRTGRFGEALAALQEAARRNQAAKDPYDAATDQVFIAMCHQQLGDPEQAKRILAALRDGVRASGDTELRGFLQEAEALIGSSR